MFLCHSSELGAFAVMHIYKAWVAWFKQYCITTSVFISPVIATGCVCAMTYKERGSIEIAWGGFYVQWPISRTTFLVDPVIATGSAQWRIQNTVILRLHWVGYICNDPYRGPPFPFLLSLLVGGCAQWRINSTVLVRLHGVGDTCNSPCRGLCPSRVFVQNNVPTYCYCAWCPNVCTNNVLYWVCTKNNTPFKVLCHSIFASKIVLRSLSRRLLYWHCTGTILYWQYY
jgi:hypothetical protein